jgi:hypothetical protein
MTHLREGAAAIEVDRAAEAARAKKKGKKGGGGGGKGEQKAIHSTYLVRCCGAWGQAAPA